MTETRHVSIIVPDNTVVVDGKSHEVGCSALTGVHAVQWDGTKGHVELTDPATPNTALPTMSDYAAIVAAWDVIEAQEVADAEAAANAPPLTAQELKDLDIATINEALLQPGSVVRAIGLVVFDLATGVIPVNPNYTLAQYKVLLLNKMRNGA